MSYFCDSTEGLKKIQINCTDPSKTCRGCLDELSSYRNVLAILKKRIGDDVASVNWENEIKPIIGDRGKLIYHLGFKWANRSKEEICKIREYKLYVQVSQNAFLLRPFFNRRKKIQILRNLIELLKNNRFKSLVRGLNYLADNLIPNSAAISILINKIYMTQNPALKKAVIDVVFFEAYTTWTHRYDADTLAAKKIFYCSELKNHYRDSLIEIEGWD